MATTIQMHRIVSVKKTSTVLTTASRPSWLYEEYIFTDSEGNKVSVGAHRITICPDCGEETTFQHHDATAAYPECSVETCEQCGYQGDPE